MGLPSRTGRDPEQNERRVQDQRSPLRLRGVVKVPRLRREQLQGT